jgi:hypothetical protein
MTPLMGVQGQCVHMGHWVLLLLVIVHFMLQDTVKTKGVYRNVFIYKQLTSILQNTVWTTIYKNAQIVFLVLPFSSLRVSLRTVACL